MATNGCVSLSLQNDTMHWINIVFHRAKIAVADARLAFARFVQAPTAAGAAQPTGYTATRNEAKCTTIVTSIRLMFGIVAFLVAACALNCFLLVLFELVGDPFETRVAAETIG